MIIESPVLAHNVFCMFYCNKDSPLFFIKLLFALFFHCSDYNNKYGFDSIQYMCQWGLVCCYIT